MQRTVAGVRQGEPTVPYYSSADQALQDHEFEMLVQLGEHVGARMCAAAARLPGYRRGWLDGPA